MKDICRYYGKIIIKVYGIGFSILGAIAIILPMPNVSKTNIKLRLLILLVIIIILAIISLLMIIRQRQSKSTVIYSKGHTKIVLEYGDIIELLNPADRDNDNFTIVVPVNTGLQSMFELDRVKNNTIHHICLEYILNSKSSEKELNDDFVNALRHRKENEDGSKKQLDQIGDWFYISGDDIKSGSKIAFIFLMMYEYKMVSGTVGNKHTKEGYLKGLQSLLEAIPILSPGDKVYIPLIGAGEAGVGSKYSVLRLLNALIGFNLNDIKQEIHIIIHDTGTKEVPIHMFPQLYS